MTPLPTVSHPAVSHPSTLLRRVLYADAAISGLSGLVMALDAAPLENLLAVPRDLLRTAWSASWRPAAPCRGPRCGR